MHFGFSFPNTVNKTNKLVPSRCVFASVIPKWRLLVRWNSAFVYVSGLTTPWPRDGGILRLPFRCPNAV